MNIVAAVVVRIPAFIAGDLVSIFLTSGLNSHRLAKIIFRKNGILGPTRSKNWAVYVMFAGNGFSSSLTMALLKMPTAVCLGGMDECPPSLFTLSSRLTYPFSAMPIRATGPEIPGMTSLTIARPSSRTYSNRTLLDLNRSAILFAPFSPPISSSWPKAKNTVRFG